jgi:hypothetical protein
MRMRHAGNGSIGVSAVVGDVGFRSKNVRYLFLRTRRDGFVVLEFRDARFIRIRNVLMSGTRVVGGHYESFHRQQSHRMSMSPARIAPVIAPGIGAVCSSARAARESAEPVG